MATGRSALARKLARILRKQFPHLDTVKIQDIDGIVGIVTSESFFGMDGMDRQPASTAIMRTDMFK